MEGEKAFYTAEADKDLEGGEGVLYRGRGTKMREAGEDALYRGGDETRTGRRRFIPEGGRKRGDGRRRFIPRRRTRRGRGQSKGDLAALDVEKETKAVGEKRL